jgi:hypothetical protein
MRKTVISWRSAATTERADGAGSRPRAPKRAGKVSGRKRRALVAWLRRVAAHTIDRDPIRRRFEVLLPDRVAGVRADLLELADLLETTHAPDPACVADLYRLLSDGCGSPLYNADVHISELRATLYYARSVLQGC